MSTILGWFIFSWCSRVSWLCSRWCSYQREKGNLKRGDHYTEQYKYIDKNVNIHIIHFENLHIEFKELMEKYNLQLKINRHSNKSNLKRKFTVQSFSPELIELINNVYHKDFEMFHYDKIKII